MPNNRKTRTLTLVLLEVMPCPSIGAQLPKVQTGALPPSVGSSGPLFLHCSTLTHAG